MIAKVIKRTELGPLDASAIALARCSPRSCAWIAVVEAHHAAIRSWSHSSMKAENWFQLRVVGVTQKAKGLRRKARLLFWHGAPSCQRIVVAPAAPVRLRGG